MAKPYLTEECLESFLNLFDPETFSDSEKEMLNNQRTEVLFKKDEIITKQGSFATQLIFIQKGLTKSYFEYGSTKQIICLHPAKSLLGIQGLAVSNIYHCTLTALEDVETCMFDLNTIKKIALKNASFVFQLLNIIIELQSTSIDRIFSIKLKADISKLADVLLCLSQRVYRSDNFDFRFTIEELADLTDVNLDGAQKIWSDFQKEKLFLLANGKLNIIDKEKLFQLSALT